MTTEPRTGGPDRRRSSRRRWLLSAGSLALSAVCLAAVLRRGAITPADVGLAFRRAASPLLLLATAVGATLAYVLVGADKQWRVLRALGVPVSYRDTLRVRLGAGPVRLLAGDAATIAVFWRHTGVPLGRVSGAVLFDRGLNLLGSVFWLVVGLLLAGGRWVAPPGLLLVGAAGLAVLFVTPLQRLLLTGTRALPGKLRRFAEGVLAPLTELGPVWRFALLAYGLLFQGVDQLVCWLLFRSFGVTVEATGFVARTALSIFAGHLPSVAGVGPREASVVLLFQDQAPPAVLLSVGLCLSLCLKVLPMLVGTPWIPWMLGEVTEPAGTAGRLPPGAADDTGER